MCDFGVLLFFVFCFLAGLEGEHQMRGWKRRERETIRRSDESQVGVCVCVCMYVEERINSVQGRRRLAVI